MAKDYPPRPCYNMDARGAVLRAACCTLLVSNAFSGCNPFYLSVRAPTEANCSTSDDGEVRCSPLCRTGRLWTVFICKGERWVIDMAVGQMCDVPKQAGCRLEGTTLLCDACNEAAIPLLNALYVLPYGLTHVIYRCQSFTTIGLEATYHMNALKYLEISHSPALTTLSPDSFLTCFELEVFNVSYNPLLTRLRADQLPSSGRLRTLDISHTGISSLPREGLHAAFDSSCDVSASIVTAASNCSCYFQHQPPNNCNLPVCSCFSEVPIRIDCPTTDQSTPSSSIAVTQLCDGSADCSDCWDEQLCTAHLTSSTFLLWQTCFGGDALFSIRRGVASIQPARAQSESTPCLAMPLDALAMNFQYNTTSQLWQSDVAYREQGIQGIVTLNATRLSFLFDSSFQGLAVSNVTDTVEVTRRGCPRGVNDGSSSSSSRLGLVLGLTFGLVALVALFAILGYHRTRRTAPVNLSPLLDKFSSAQHNSSPIPQYAG